MNTLHIRIQKRVHETLDKYQGAWLVWCDPTGYWLPLLEVAASSGNDGFNLMQFSDYTAQEFGSPVSRASLQKQLDREESFVLYVRTSSDKLGWLWAQALRAEEIYAKTLFQQLREWGWRPQRLNIDERELALLAQQNLQQDPTEWGGEGLKPNPQLLLPILSGKAEPPAAENIHRLVLDLTLETAGLQPLPAEAIAYPAWRSRIVAQLLTVQAQAVAPSLVSENHELLANKSLAQRLAALELIRIWEDSRSLLESLFELVPHADRIAALTNLPLLSEKVKAADGPFLSYAVERLAFANTCRELIALTGRELLQKLSTLEKSLENHERDGVWSNKPRNSTSAPPLNFTPVAWGELLRLSRAARALLDNAPAEEWINYQEAIGWYTAKGWKVDRAGEEIFRSLSVPDSDLLKLISTLRETYRARWEDYLMRWSAVWLAAGCPTQPADVPTAGEWLRKLLDGQRRATAIIVSDAMRYDIGASLAEHINQSEGGLVERASIQPARTAIPTITALGMGMALPIEENELVAELTDNGRWQLRQKNDKRNLNLSEKEDRREWWRTYRKVSPDALLEMSQVLNGTVHEVPPVAANRTLLVLFDDIIDKMGHEEIEGLGSDHILERYVRAITHLRDRGWLRVVVVTDHGFIQWTGSEEKSLSLPLPNPAFSSRRALAYPTNSKGKSETKDLPQALAPGEKWQVVVPRGAGCFRTYGGLGFFHGGASLEEWIIPCVKVEWPIQVKPLGVKLQPLPKLLSLRVRVTLTVNQDYILVEERMPRSIEIVIKETASGTRLFRTNAPVNVTPDQSEVSVTLQPEAGAQAERGSNLLIEARDSRDQELLDSVSSVLLVDMDGW